MSIDALGPIDPFGDRWRAEAEPREDVVHDVEELAPEPLEAPAQPQKSSRYNPVFHMMKVERMLKDLSNQTMGRPISILERENKELEECQKKELTQAQEKIAAGYAASLWQYMTSLIDVVNVFFGGALIYSGVSPVTGYTLASSGLISLGNTALIQAGKWNDLAALGAAGDEERQKRLAEIMPHLVQLVSIALGTYGLVQSGVLNAHVGQLVDRLKKVSQWLTMGTNAGTAYSDIKLSKAEGHLLQTDKEIYSHEKLVKRLGEEVGELMRLFQEASRQAKAPVKEYLKTMSELTKRDG